jgi:putative transposase
MKGTRHSEEQIIAILKQGEAGIDDRGVMPTAWDQRADLLPLAGDYGGMESGEAKRLKQVEDENRKLKHVVAELTLDNRALKDVLRNLAQSFGCPPLPDLATSVGR